MKTPHFVFKRAHALGASDLWAKDNVNAAAIQAEITRRDPSKTDRVGVYATVKKDLWGALSKDTQKQWQSAAEGLARKTREELEKDSMTMVFE